MHLSFSTNSSASVMLKTCLRPNKSVDLSHVETDLAEEVVKEIKDEIKDVKTLLV